MESSDNNGKIIGALLLGAIIGGALGVLFAPGKGSDTRKKILAKGEDLSEAMKEKLKEFMDQLKNEAEKVKDKAAEYVENGSKKEEKTTTR